MEHHGGVAVYPLRCLHPAHPTTGRPGVRPPFLTLIVIAVAVLALHLWARARKPKGG